MTQKIVLSIVIDANVARSAGPEGATHPTSKRCRDFLLAVEKLEFHIVSTLALREEWNKHQSAFFKLWRAQMMGKKRIDVLSVEINENLREKLNKVAKSERERDDMIKDYHLLEAALESDRRVVSCETLVRRHFAHACKSVGEINAILWINPTDETEGIFMWLENGAPDEEKRRLKNYL